MKLGTTRRALLGAFATAPITVTLASASQPVSARVNTADWDAALEAYLEARDAYDADLKSGDLRRAYDRHHAEYRAICRKYGVSDTKLLTNEAGIARAKASAERVFEAERIHELRFCDRRGEALERLMLTRPPTYAALRQKIWIANSELLEDVDGKPMLQIVGDDLAGLTGRGA